MKARYWMIALFLFLIVFGVEYDIARRTQAKAVEASQKTVQVAQVSALPVTPAAEVTLPLKSATFEQYFLVESRQIANLQANPAEIEQRLDNLAEAITPTDIQKLSKIMQDVNSGGDERALAVEILSRKRTPEALMALEDFVKSHETTTKENWSRSQEFESVMRAQAVEGIAAYPQKETALTSLNTLAKQVDESFLLDRIARSSENVKGNVPSTQQQDDDALRKLIE